MNPIPIVITNRNRATSIAQLVDWCLTLECVGEIVVVDNGSTWEPTAALYADWAARKLPVPITIVRRDNVLGRASAREVAMARYPCGTRIVYTDPDLVPYPDTPRDILRVLSDFLDAYPSCVPDRVGFQKAGPALEINDLPANCLNRDPVRVWEAQFWQNRTPCGKAFCAAIDTTFAMYRNPSDYLIYLCEAARLDRPYRLRHVDWYEDKDNPTAEYLHYVRTANHEASWGTFFRNWWVASKECTVCVPNPNKS